MKTKQINAQDVVINSRANAIIIVYLLVALAVAGLLASCGTVKPSYSSRKGKDIPCASWSSSYATTTSSFR